MGISSPSGAKFAYKKLDDVRYHTMKTVVSISPGLKSVTDGRTDKQNYDS